MRNRYRTRAVQALLNLGDLPARQRAYRQGLPPLAGLHRDVPYGPHPRQRLDILLPSGEGTFPILINIPGGGWISGDKSIHTRLCAAVASAGYLVYNLNYRLAPQFPFPVQLQDIARALSFILADAPARRGDPTRLVFMGDSAGAHLGLWYACALQQDHLFSAFQVPNPLPPSALQACLFYYGLYDLQTAQSDSHYWVRFFSRTYLDTCSGPVREQLEMLSPLHLVHAGLPPVLVSCGHADPLYSQSLALLAELERCRAPAHRLLLEPPEFAGVGHSFMKRMGYPAARFALRQSLSFLKDVIEQ